MNAARIALGLLVSLALLAAIALAYSSIAWRVARRLGTKGLGVSFLVAVLLLTALATLQLRWRAAMTGVHLPGTVVWQNLVLYLVGCLFAFGLSTLSLRKALAQSDVPRVPGPAARRSVGAFFGGVGVLLLLALVSDVVRLFSVR